MTASSLKILLFTVLSTTYVLAQEHTAEAAISVAGTEQPPVEANTVPAPTTTETSPNKSLPEKAADNNIADQGSIYSRPNARVMTLATPGIRGAILDRNGLPLAISMVSYYPALQFKQFEHEDKEQIIAWGRERIEHANTIYKLKWNPSDQVIWEHYRYRRWMAMPYTFFVISEELKEQTEGRLMDGLILHPIYQRTYPNNSTAAHVIGYTGIKGKLEKGPINFADPIFPYTSGRSGLELIYDEYLQGRRGLKRLQYSSDGEKFPEEVIQTPTIGSNVITTLDLQWQKKAETILRKHSKKSAFVVIDIQTGEVLVMASQPSFDLNLWVPRILSSDYTALREDKEKPLFGRAFSAAYPPASTFKVFVALAGLQHRYINRNTQVPCPAYFEYNNHKFWDWSRSGRGNLSVIQAIELSNNPFFYTLGKNMKSSNIIDFARRFGFGKKTGLPLLGESPGKMPDNDWMLKHHRRRMHTGDHYNNAIGQGVLLVTPLQVAQSMAAIANGSHLPQLRLIKQIQTPRGKVIAANTPDVQSSLKIDPLHIATIKEGMCKVVHGSRGTGRSASLSYVTMCAKTGTGQWKTFQDDSKNQNIAWFAGFFPLNQPRYAFAALYEGDKGEKISGGKAAGNLVNKFFETIKSDVQAELAPPIKAVVAVPVPLNDAPTPAVPDGTIPKAIAIDPNTGEVITPRAVPVEANPNEAQPIPPASHTDDPTDTTDIPKAVPVQPQAEEIPKAVPVTP